MGRGRGLAVLAGLSLAFGSSGVRALNTEFNVSEIRVEGETTTRFEFNVNVDNGLLTSVAVTPPGGAPIPLDPSDPNDPNDLGWDYFESFSTLAELEEKFAPGWYLIEFNGGPSSVDLEHSAFSPPL